jgi:hypothetical protein
VEGSKLYLFSVIMPVKCVFSISPRFHYRRLAFCFLPLAAILGSPWVFFLIYIYLFNVLVGLGWNSGLCVCKAMLYHLIHTSSLFCFGYFGDGGLENCLPRLASNHDPPHLNLTSS